MTHIFFKTTDFQICFGCTSDSLFPVSLFAYWTISVRELGYVTAYLVSHKLTDLTAKTLKYKVNVKEKNSLNKSLGQNVCFNRSVAAQY